MNIASFYPAMNSYYVTPFGVPSSTGGLNNTEDETYMGKREWRGLRDGKSTTWFYHMQLVLTTISPFLPFLFPTPSNSQG